MIILIITQNNNINVIAVNNLGEEKIFFNYKN